MIGDMQEKYIKICNLNVSESLLKFVNDELLKDTEISSEKFWAGFDKAVHELSPKNKELIIKRQELQKKIDEWHVKKKEHKLKSMIIKIF